MEGNDDAGLMFSFWSALVEDGGSKVGTRGGLGRGIEDMCGSWSGCVEDGVFPSNDMSGVDRLLVSTRGILEILGKFGSRTSDARRFSMYGLVCSCVVVLSVGVGCV